MTTTLASSGTRLHPDRHHRRRSSCPSARRSRSSYGTTYRLQRHRADAVAMASYRKLAEEAVASMAELRSEMAKLTEHVSAVEQLMRDVG